MSPKTELCSDLEVKRDISESPSQALGLWRPFPTEVKLRLMLLGSGGILELRRWAGSTKRDGRGDLGCKLAILGHL